MVKIRLPDNSIKEFENAVTAYEVALSISEGLARNVIASKVNGEVWDITRPITEDSDVTLLTWRDDEGKSTFWHSSAHLMAAAIAELYPKAIFGTGPDIENGFYYDVDFGEESFSEHDFAQVEKKMLELAREKHGFIRKSVDKETALKEFPAEQEPYKNELISGLDDGTITFYESGSFTDLCAGPHLPNSSLIKAVKLMKVAGAYWRGKEENPQMTRVYGITFPKQKELKEYLALLEEAKKRDHRKLGKELGLFTFSQKVGQGLPLWLPKGAKLRENLENFLRKAQSKAGYDQVVSPHIGNKELYVTSGHYAKYGEDSFQPINTPAENEEFLLKPMNCPHHCEMYKASPHSYKDLPIRYAEFGTVYRYEQSGELHGLTRVRGFTQDDAHIFMTPDQVEEEFMRVIDLVLFVFKSLGFEDYVAQVSLRDRDNHDKYIGSTENWDKAEAAIINASKEKGLETVVEYGEAAFYGPKLDFMVKDAIGRKWQLGTIQVDYNLPERFELEYTGSDNAKHRPVMIHRAPFGSLERFVAILIEHCEGRFPLWLNPDQIAILPISEKYQAYAESVQEQLIDLDIRSYVDNRNEKIGKKIRETEIKHVPYMLVIGEKEMEDGTVSIRKSGDGDKGVQSVADFIEFFQKEAEMPKAK
jgi:threonyl-tRNA synthetase